MFYKTRLKLTAWYLLILATISFAFSITIYRFLSLEMDRFAHVQKIRIERKFEDRIPPEILRKMPPTLEIIDPDIVRESKTRVIYILLGVNSGIMVLSGLLSYFLSGITLKPIKQMMEEQDRFVSDASHELRTPLTSLKTSIEVGLRDKKLTLAESKKVLSENLTDINRLSTLASSLLELSRYQKISSNSEFVLTKIKPLISLAITRVKPQAQSKNIKISHKSGDTQINADGNKITEMLTILLDNAIKYSPPKSTVKIFTSKSKRFLFIHVQDQGMGIAEGDLPNIFDRFFRSDKARTSIQTDGFGLGLSIAKNIIDSHRGTIRVESKINQGSTFHIKLPLTQKFS